MTATTNPTPRQQRADAYLEKLRARSVPKKPPVPLDVALAILAVFVALVASGPKAALITAGACAALICIIIPIVLAACGSGD